MKIPSIAAATERGTRRRGTDASETLKLSGQATTGRGKETSILPRNAGNIRDALGIDVVEGPLNILLKRPLMLADKTAIYMSLDTGLLCSYWPGRLNGTDVWVQRSPTAPLHVVELLSTVPLRKQLHLSDGDNVELEVRTCDVEPISNANRLAWTVFWLGRKNWIYTRNSYCDSAERWCKRFGGIQGGTEENCRDLLAAMAKALIRRIPGARLLVAYPLRQDLWGQYGRRPYRFERVPLDGHGTDIDRSFAQVCNLLNYTKTSETLYSAARYPAGYHTIEIDGRRLQGQRIPSERLKPVPVDFHGKTVLDIGCNQGGMLFELSNLKWGVGLDYDAHMINAANRIKSLREFTNLNFYVLDLEKEPLNLIEDFMPEPKVDIVFLLAVCMWISNWQEVISYSASISESMLFETTGPDEQQELQEAYLRKLYGDIVLVAGRSEDDPGRKQRKLFYCRR
jgi:hypothetical protein